MSAARARLGVLVSGSGSNLQALLDACSQPDYPAEVACVLSNVPTAFALERARKARVPSVVVLEHKAFASRADFERTIGEELRKAGVEWVCLAGFMRLLSANFLAGFPGRVLNIHPALLPAFPGLHAQRQALERGVKIAGCTVHFVDAGTDTGPIIAQAAVPVLPEDDEASLSARILREEHWLYPLAVRLAVTGKVTMQEARTLVDAEATTSELSLRNPGSAAMTERTREERLAALREARVVLVSACLLGEACRYDGKSKGSDPVMLALEGKEVVPVCPETGAGLGIPRPAVELRGGTGEAVLAGQARAVVAATGEDRTAAFRHGAELALEAARRFGATVAVLKERSPSCGTRGTHVDGVVVPGRGVTAALLHSAGITVLSDEEL